ncbi:MAG: benzoyl-CoA 2,3-epoxidase subunit BoxB [Planctomycetota bacterium]
MSLFDKIPNNVNLSEDKRLQRALEKWLPNFLDWWTTMGPDGFQEKEIYLRTAVGVDQEGWAQFEHVKMPDYRWGIFLTPKEVNTCIGFGDHEGTPAYEEVPGEYRNSLKRMIVTQADTEPASVEQQRLLGHTAPSLYDLRNLFQVNVEEGRHLWAMVYLLHGYFGSEGRDEADELLERRSGDPDKPRILDAFNAPCRNWIDFFAFTTFTDRDGKYQLGALAESGFDPMARTCRFMLMEEAHHLFVGATGIERILRRTAQLMKQDPNEEVTKLGGVPFELIQRRINYWYTYSLDLFGAEIGTNAGDWFAEGLKGRFHEKAKYKEHKALNEKITMTMIENEKLVEQEVELRKAMNEVLRSEYVKDCQIVLRKWNSALEEEGVSYRVTLPSIRFHRHQGVYKNHCFDPQGNIITPEEFARNKSEWLPTTKDDAYLESIMKPATGVGQIANWITPPRLGVNNKPFEFEYVRL